jgi:hypothetical protein
MGVPLAVLGGLLLPSAAEQIVRRETRLTVDTRERRAVEG